MASIRKRGDKYHVQVRRKGCAPASRSFHIKADAEEWARHMDTRADRGDLPTPVKVLASIKVKDILERYRNEITVKKRSAPTETYILNALLRQSIANLTLANVTPAHFSTYRDKRLKEVKPGTVKRELGIMKHAFDIAEREWDMPIRSNPLAKLKRLKAQEGRNRRLMEGEYEALLSAMAETRNKHIRSLIDFAIETGMRRGEILRMRWQDINFETRTLLIPVTKNGHSRTIPLSSDAMTLLSEVQSKEKVNKDRPFPLSDNAAKLAWQRLIERAEIQDLHFHDLRHEAISRFFERGLSLPEVALISGHKDFRMLFRYTHLKAEDVAQKLINRLS